MTDISILMQPDMAAATWDGCKTQTRRPLYVLANNFRTATCDQRYPWDGRVNPETGFPRDHGPDQCWTLSRWAKVQAGDVLWVKERHWRFGVWDYQPDRDGHKWKFLPDRDMPCEYGSAPDGVGGKRVPHKRAYWPRPSIFMERECSRMTLLVEAVRIERVKEITRADCLAEGAPWEGETGPFGEPMIRIEGRSYHHETATLWFHRVWDSIHGVGGSSWDANPWVVAISFRRERCNIDNLGGGRMINKLLLLGYVGGDPEMRRTQQGSKIATFSLATSERWRDKATGERKENTSWHRVVVLNEGLADVVEKHVRKGSRVYVEGMQINRKFEKKNGEPGYASECAVKGFQGRLLLMDASEGRGPVDEAEYGRPMSSGDAKPGAARADMDDEIPF